MNMDIDTLVARATSGDRAALETLIGSVRDDVYHLALRMLGLRADAEDATQEIVIQVLTHLSQFRGESSFRTWVWRIGARHLMRIRKSKREEVARFDQIEKMIEAGDQNPPMPQMSNEQLKVLAEEVRLSCTAAMVLSLDRDQRIAWILGEIFELGGEDGAAVLEIEPAAFRKRLSRARERLGEWMGRHCGLVEPKRACRCARQVPIAMAAGVVLPGALEYASHPEGDRRRNLPMALEADEIERAASTLKDHPDYAAPEALRARIRTLLDSGRYSMLRA